MVEHSLGKGEVVGSIPTGSTIFIKGSWRFSGMTAPAKSREYPPPHPFALAKIVAQPRR